MIWVTAYVVEMVPDGDEGGMVHMAMSFPETSIVSITHLSAPLGEYRWEIVVNNGVAVEYPIAYQAQELRITDTAAGLADKLASVKMAVDVLEASREKTE